jgi:hypothetical protein
MKCGTRQGKGMQGIIQTLAANCAPILDCSEDARKTLMQTGSNNMVLGAVRASFEFSLLVSQQNYCDLSLTELDNALKRLYIKKGAA